MSLSQKYAGLVLTPWRDLEEWRTAKGLIYSDTEQSQQKGLERLKIWKLKTPLLSVGVEGTLILLEALLENQKNLTDYEIAHISSTALLRFLNICAGSNDRQSTFYKTAEKNGLPYWLITLRHDIAHDHKIPSKSILQMALNECFKWIKEKYWDVQDLYMKDYVISDETNFKELFYYYAQLNLLCFFEENADSLISTIKTQFKYTFPDDFDKEAATTTDFLVLLEDFLLMSVTDDKIRDTSIYIVSALVDNGILLYINYTCINGVKKIPSQFLHIWAKVLNLLLKNGTLFLLINKLADVTESNIHEYSVKEIASLWIAELYQGLSKMKKMKEEFDAVKAISSEPLDSRTAHLILKSMYNNNPTFKNTVTFDESERLPIEYSKAFQEKILRRPNEHTLNYLELVLKFNGNTHEFVKEQIKSVKNLVQLSTTFYTDSETIHTVKDLLEIAKEADIEMRNGFQIDDFKETAPKKKFKKLTDAEKFRFNGYPLGVMPPQLS